MEGFELVLFWGFAIWWGWQIILLTKTGDIFFKKLEFEQPKYHAILGYPSYKPLALIRNHRAQIYVQNLMFRGIPKDFPKDKELRKQAKYLKYLWTRAFVAFAIFFVIFAVI